MLWVTRAGGRRQDLPLPGPAASRIDAYLAGRPGPAGDQALFATRTGGRLFAADVRRTLRRLATRAGLPADQARHLGPRTIRQSFTTLYLQAGAPPGLHSSTRHADSRTTQRSGQAQPRHPHQPQLHPAYQARDPDPPLWPRGRPHCRAPRPQHVTRQTRPRLAGGGLEGTNQDRAVWPGHQPGPAPQRDRQAGECRRAALPSRKAFQTHASKKDDLGRSLRIAQGKPDPFKIVKEVSPWPR